MHWIQNNLRKAFILAVASGFILSRLMIQPAPAGVLYVTFNNASQQGVQQIHINFGNADSQSDLRIFRLAAGEKRLVPLLHAPAQGFNVEVTYADGTQQAFCANRGQEGWHQQVILKP